MTTEKMNVHKALAELKILDDRIIKAINSVEACISNKHSNTKVKGVDIKVYTGVMKSSYDKATDLIKRREAIKRAVVLSNAVTKVTVADKEYLEGFASRRQRRVERAVKLAPDPDHLAVGEDEADVFPRVEHAAQRNGSARRRGRARVGPVESDRSAGRQRHRGRRPGPQGLRVGFHRRRNDDGRPVTAAVHR